MNIAAGVVRTLEPGDYGRARLAGDVTLVAGEYHFTTLELLESATLLGGGRRPPRSK